MAKDETTTTTTTKIRHGQVIAGLRPVLHIEGELVLLQLFFTNDGADCVSMSIPKWTELVAAVSDLIVCAGPYGRRP